jgi:hypothetical protein
MPRHNNQCYNHAMPRTAAKWLSAFIIFLLLFQSSAPAASLQGALVGAWAGCSIGFVLGMVAGAFSGVSSGDYHNEVESLATTGLVCACVGLVVGGIVGYFTFPDEGIVNQPTSDPGSWSI